MTQYHKALRVSDLSDGMKKTVFLSGKKIALAKIDGDFFAVDDTCSHEQCSLGSEGFLDGTVIICGCHGATFDITNGKVLSLPAPVDIGSYETKIENGEVYIKF